MKTTQFVIRLTVIVISLAMAAACATYHPMPLDSEAEQKVLAPPDMKAVMEEAGNIKHPVLKPIEINIDDGLSPDEAAILAVLANPELKAVRDRSMLANAQLLQAKLLPNPVFSYSRDVPSGGSDQGTVQGYGTGLEWLVTSILTHGLHKKAAQAEAKSVNLGIAWQEWQVAEAARLQVYRLIVSERELEPARKTEGRLAGDLAAVKKAVELGEMTNDDLATAQAAWYQGKQAVLGIEQELEKNRQELNGMLGLPPDYKMPIQKNVALPDRPSLPKAGDIVESLSSSRLDLLALKQGFLSRDAELRAAIRAQFPSIVLGINHLKDTGNVITKGYTVSMDLPVFDRNQGAIAEARASRKQLYDDYGARLFEARAQVSEILSDMKIMKQRIAAAEKTLPELRSLAESYRKALDDGTVTVFDLTRAERATLEGRIELLKLRFNLVELGTALELASGRYFPANKNGGVRQ